jgi:ankyrin repeat protein
MEPKGYAILGGAADIKSFCNYAFRWTVIRGHLDILELLIKHGSEDNNQKMLKWTVRNGYLDIVKSFIKYNTVDIHYDNELILRSASRYGHLELVEYLISHNADVHAENDEALRSASSNGHLAVVELLLKH